MPGWRPSTAKNYVLTFNPAQLFGQVQKTVNALTKTLTFTARLIGNDSAEIRVDFASCCPTISCSSGLGIGTTVTVTFPTRIP